MFFPFTDIQVALCKNTWWHQPTSPCSECSAPYGAVLGPLLFLIMVIDIDKCISPRSKLVRFVDDTRVYSCINDIEKCDQLQIDLNSVYDWAQVNNMFLMPRNVIMYHLMVL